MAAEIEHDCPNCPGTESAEMPPCDFSMKANCTPEDLPSTEPRSLQVKAKDLPNDLLVSIGPELSEFARPVDLAQSLRDSSVFLDPGGPSRNILFCVYLK